MIPLAARFETHSSGKSFHAGWLIAVLDRFALKDGVDLRDTCVARGTAGAGCVGPLANRPDIAVPAATY